jgi:hypothetical protein
MFDEAMLAQLESNYRLMQPKKPQPAKKKGGKGGTLTSLISEGGAIGGGAAGAAIGSGILPGIGTLVGGGLGAAIGAFGGRVAENKVRDDRIGVGDAAKEAALSGILGAGPGRLLKGATTAVKTARGGASLEDALIQGGNRAVSASAAKATGDRLAKAGEGLIAKEFRLNPTQQANFRKLHGEEAVSVLRRYNVKRPEDVQAKIMPLQSAFDDVVDRIPSASKGEVAKAMKAIYEPLIKSKVLTTQALGQQVKAQADAIIKGSGGQVSATELNTLRQAFDGAVNYTQRGTSEFGVNKKSADAIRKLLQQKADDAGLQFEGKTFRDVGLELRKLRNIDDIVGKQSYLGTGSLPANIPALLGGIGGGAVAGGPAGAALGLGGTILLNSPAGRRAIANTTLRGGEKLAARGEAANPYGVAGVAKRIAPVGLAGALLEQSQSEKSTQPTTMMTPNNSIQPNASIGGLSQIDEGLSTDSPFAPENLENAIAQIINSGGTVDDAAKFVGLATSIQKIRQSGQAGQKPMSAEAAKVTSNAQLGLQALDDLEGTISSDPSALRNSVIPGRGVAGGILGRALGTQELDAARQQVVDVIARLRTGAAITNDEAARFTQFLPVAADTPDVQAQKLNYLRTQFADILQRTGNSANSLEDALMSVQGV